MKPVREILDGCPGQVMAYFAGQLEDGLGPKTTIEMIVEHNFRGSPQLRVSQGSHANMVRVIRTVSV